MNGYTRMMPPHPIYGVRPAYVPRLLGVTFGGTARERDGFYRIRTPLRLLADSGYKAGWLCFSDQDLPIADLVKNYEAVVVSERAGSGIVRACQAARTIVMVDVDRPDFCRDTVAAASGIIAASPEIADLVRPYHPIIEVLPTYADSRIWMREGARIETNPVIGVFSWDGDTWLSLVRPLQIITHEYPDVSILVDAAAPPALCDMADLVISDHDLSMQAEHRYRLSVDIGLCLSHSVSDRGVTPFVADRLGRPNGIYAYGMAETAVIGSPCYTSLLRSKGAIADTCHEWVAAMRRYLDDGPRRRRDAFALRRYVEDRVDIGDHGLRVVAAYRSLYQRIIGDWFVAKSV